MKAVALLVAVISLHPIGMAYGKDAYVCAEYEAVGFANRDNKERQTTYNTNSFTMVLDGNNASIKLKTESDTHLYKCNFDSKSRYMECNYVEGFYHLAFDLYSFNFYRTKIYPDDNDKLVSKGSCQKM